MFKQKWHCLKWIPNKNSTLLGNKNKWRQNCSSPEAKITCMWSPVYLKHWFWESSQWCLRLEDQAQTWALMLQEQNTRKVLIKQICWYLHKYSLNDFIEDFRSTLTLPLDQFYVPFITGTNNLQTNFRKCWDVFKIWIKWKLIFYNILFTIEHKEHNKCLNETFRLLSTKWAHFKLMPATGEKLQLGEHLATNKLIDIRSVIWLAIKEIS